MKAPKAEGQQSSGGRTRNHRARSQTRRHGGSHWFAFGLLTMATALMPARLSAAPTAELDGPLQRLTLTVRVYNYAKVSAGNLRCAQSEAGRIIGKAGVETVWLDCPLTRAASLQAQTIGQPECSGEEVGAIVTLRVLNRSNYNSATFKREVFGYADGPSLASVVYDRVAGLANADGDLNEAPVILGVAIAHEIGHLLLGRDAHSPTGIMRGRWDRAQLQRALWGRQLFSPDQSTRIRVAMEARMKLQGTSLASQTAK